MSDVATKREYLWRKQILPFGMVEHAGREVVLDARLLGNLASAFSADALNLVPVLLDGGSGLASYDPALRAGRVCGLEVVSDGLDAMVAVELRADAIVSANPEIGGAPGICIDYQVPDGRRFPAVLRHIMVTGSPLIAGLRPWQRVCG
jgi:hypothetical protein